MFLYPKTIQVGEGKEEKKGLASAITGMTMVWKHLRSVARETLILPPFSRPRNVSSSRLCLSLLCSYLLATGNLDLELMKDCGVATCSISRVDGEILQPADDVAKRTSRQGRRKPHVMILSAAFSICRGVSGSFDRCVEAGGGR